MTYPNAGRRAFLLGAFHFYWPFCCAFHSQESCCDHAGDPPFVGHSSHEKKDPTDAAGLVQSCIYLSRGPSCHVLAKSHEARRGCPGPGGECDLGAVTAAVKSSPAHCCWEVRQSRGQGPTGLARPAPSILESQATAKISHLRLPRGQQSRRAAAGNYWRSMKKTNHRAKPGPLC